MITDCKPAYIIAQSDCIGGLEREVKRYIAQHGFEPLGGVVAVCGANWRITWAQAMVPKTAGRQEAAEVSV